MVSQPTNILSFVKIEYEVRFDSGASNCFELAKKDRSGRKMVFNKSPNGLYFFMLTKRKRHHTHEN